MAMHDLAADLDRDNIKLDGEMERRVVAIILKHLEDTGTDVKQQAVRTIASLARKVQQPQLEEIADKLATHILNKTDEEKRDIGSIGLKTLVGVLTQQTAPAVLKRVTPKLQQGIAMEAEVAHYCLEILNDLLKSFGMIMSRDLASIQSGILPMLSSPVAATRKRVSTCVASLAICAPDQLFVTLIGSIFNNIEASRNADQIRTYIQTIAGISRSVGHRLGRELKRIIPLFMSFCEDDKYKEDTEMLENCLQAFESFVLRCPKEIGPHLDSIIATGIAFIKHDPNYADEEDEDEDLMDEDEPEDEFSDDGDYSGDDDNSWKVRTAAVKCLGAVIRTRPEMLTQLYERVLPVLMARFREREEIVKMEVFSAFKDLLRQSQGSADVVDAMDEDPPSLGRSSASVLRMLDVDRVVKVVLKQLKDKSFKTKEKCLELLRELIAVLNGGLGAYLNALIPDMERAIDKAAKTSLKVEALTCLCALLEKHPGADFTQHVTKLGPAVIASVSDCNYKISAVALRVCGRLTLCTLNGKPLLAASNPFVLNMYTAVFSRLSSQDQDLEVKEAAIVTTGQIVSTLGDVLGPENLNSCLPVMLERLRNETTRVTSLKALSTIARSELKIDVSSISSDAVLECSSFLRKNDRGLKQAALTTLTDLVASYSGSISAPLYQSVARELAALVTDAELHLTHLVLQLCVCMVRCAPQATTPLVQQFVLPRSLLLLQSPLLQGPARASLRSLFATLAASAVPGCGFQQLLDELLGVVKAAPAPLSRQSLSSIAQCISSLCGAVPPEQRTQTLQGFIAQLSDPGAPEQAKLLLLHAVGEIGKGFDLSGFALEKVLMAALLEGSEDTKAAASLALGSLAMGATRQFLPYILQQVAAQTEIRYLLLQALRQLITLKTAEEGKGSSEGGDRMGGELPRVLELLMGQCGAEDEGVRSMVAECLGRLGLICPAEVLPRLQELVKQEHALTRATAVYALKFTITDKAPMAELAGCIADFLALIRDGEIVVRKAALTALNSSAHNKPPLIRPVLSSDWLLPALYGETAYKKELVRTVNLGPFQHKVDDGAELRKLALACMDTLLDKSADKLDTSLFLQHLQARLSDELDDIKQAAYQLLSKLAVREPFCVREVLDLVSEPLQAVLSKRPKESASPQDIERHNELQRSAIQTVVVLHKMPESSTCLKFQAMYDGILQDAKLKALVDSVSTDADGTAPPMPPP